MNELLMKLKEKQKTIQKTENIFMSIEDEDNKKIYHTKIFSDIYRFGINKADPNKFFISVRGLFNLKKIAYFNIFKSDGDEFLGIFYGFNKKFRPININIENSGNKITLRNHYFIEFKFKKGSVICYLKGLHFLLEKTNEINPYYETLLNSFTNLEKEVYEFYGKKLQSGGIINKWIEKRQK